MSEVSRFDFEQELLRCWTVTDDLKLFADNNASPEDYKALSQTYQIHFDKLWNTFERMVAEGKMK